MSRPCTVCTHPRRAEVDRALVAGEAFHKISVRFGIPKATVFRHRTHIGQRLALARRRAAEERARHMGEEDAGLLEQQEQQLAAAAAIDVDVVEELQRSVQRMIRLCEACDRWLADPEDPDCYDLSPRAEEITVTYSEDDGPRRRASLADLLARLGASVRSHRIEMEAADPRRLLVLASARMQSQLQLLAHLDGQLQPEVPEINVWTNPQWLAIRSCIMETLAPYPQIEAEFVSRLEALEVGSDASHG